MREYRALWALRESLLGFDGPALAAKGCIGEGPAWGQPVQHTAAEALAAQQQAQLPLYTAPLLW